MSEVKTGLAMKKILIVEDEPLFGELLRITLSGEPEFDVDGIFSAFPKCRMINCGSILLASGCRGR